jgi:hypothetical protein
MIGALQEKPHLAFLRTPDITAIAALNDAVRCDPMTRGHVIFDPRVMALIDTDTPRKLAPVVIAQHALLRLVRDCTDCTDCTDFTGSDRDRAERRLGQFQFRLRTLGFTIDYHEAASTGPARDPANPTTARRILTIMLVDGRASATASTVPGAGIGQGREPELADVASQRSSRSPRRRAR